MSFQNVNRLFGLYAIAWRQIRRVSYWWPLLLLITVSGVALTLFGNYTSAFPYAILTPYLRLMNALVESLGIAPNTLTGFSHYPQLFMLLPTQFEWGRVLIGVVFEGAVIALTARAIARGSAAPVSGRFGATRWIVCAGLWFVTYALLSAVTYTLPEWFAGWHTGSPRRTLALEFALFAANIAILAPLAYAIPLVGLRDYGPVRAILASLRMFWRHRATTFFLLFLPSLAFTYPLTVAISPSAGLTTRLQPEIVVWLLAALIIMNALVTFIYVAGVTQLTRESRAA